jgi:hypothetical protein
MSMKNSNDTIWNRTSDLRFVAQHLNHCTTAVPHLSCLHTKKHIHVFSTMRTTCPTQPRQRPWFHHHLLKTINHASPHYAVFSSLPLILPSIPQHAILEHSQPVCFSEHKRPPVTSLQDNMHSYTAVHVYRYVVQQNAERQMTPDHVITWRPSVHRVTTFFIGSVLIWRWLSQIFNFAPFNL